METDYSIALITIALSCWCKYISVVAFVVYNAIILIVHVAFPFGNLIVHPGATLFAIYIIGTLMNIQCVPPLPDPCPWPCIGSFLVLLSPKMNVFNIAMHCPTFPHQ